MNVSNVRQATASDHRAVEGLMPLMRHNLQPDEYTRCLVRLYGVVAAWEEQSSTAAPDWLSQTLYERQRLPMLTYDLACFHTPLPQSRSSLPELDNPYSMLGSMYVMEGSTLGGQIIARHVEHVLGTKHGHGNAFFLGHGSRTGSMWKEFCTMLEVRVPESETETVILGAKAMFAAFGEWMQGIPAPIDI